MHRYERKFLTHTPHPEHTRQLLAMHPAAFSVAFPKRRVNSLYFDTKNLTYFTANAEGNNPRIKIRVRWYGELNVIAQPQLEIKIKENSFVSKRVIKLDTVYKNTHQHDITHAVTDAIVHADELSSLVIKTQQHVPVVAVSYLREYHLSSDETVRATLDSDVSFYAADHSPQSTSAARSYNQTILELKYDPSHDAAARKMSAALPYRVSKSSKYELAVRSQYPSLAW